jgi:hypothetical protein
VRLFRSRPPSAHGADARRSPFERRQRRHSASENRETHERITAGIADLGPALPSHLRVSDNAIEL